MTLSVFTMMDGRGDSRCRRNGLGSAAANNTLEEIGTAT